MIPELDIYRFAHLLVKQHGTEAAIHASMLDRGDLDGQRVWFRILDAVGEFPDTRPADAATVH